MLDNRLILADSLNKPDDQRDTEINGSKLIFKGSKGVSPGKTPV